MKMEKLPRGLWPVMLTPFLENNEVDYESLEQLTDFYINTGAKGLFSNCLSGEMFQLTETERLQVIRKVVGATRSRVNIVASGTFSRNMEVNSEFIKKVYDTGVDAVVILSNQIADIDENDDVFKDRIEVLLKLTGEIPLGVYECPYPYKRLMQADLMKWLASTGRFYYHKDTSCNLESIRSKLNVTQGTAFSLYNANTATALTSLERGVAGISPIGANLYPELYAYLFGEFERNGTTDKLVELNSQLDLMDVVADQCYPLSAKLFLQYRGFTMLTISRIQHDVMRSENYLKLSSLFKVFRRTADIYNIQIEKFQ